MTRILTTDLLRAAENEIRNLGIAADERYYGEAAFGTEEKILRVRMEASKSVLRDIDSLCHSLARLELSDAELSRFDRDNRLSRCGEPRPFQYPLRWNELTAWLYGQRH